MTTPINFRTASGEPVAIGRECMLEVFFPTMIEHEDGEKAKVFRYEIRAIVGPVEHNLLSVHGLTRMGATFTFGPNSCSIQIADIRRMSCEIWAAKGMSTWKKPRFLKLSPTKVLRVKVVRVQVRAAFPVLRKTRRIALRVRPFPSLEPHPDQRTPVMPKCCSSMMNQKSMNSSPIRCHPNHRSCVNHGLMH